MAIEFTNRPTCTICATQKQQTNHWWLIVISRMGKLPVKKVVRVNEELTDRMIEEGWSYPGGQGEEAFIEVPSEIHICAWSDALAPVADGCACGEACAHKALSRWFETGTLDAPHAAAAARGDD